MEEIAEEKQSEEENEEEEVKEDENAVFKAEFERLNNKISAFITKNNGEEQVQSAAPVQNIPSSLQRIV